MKRFYLPILICVSIAVGFFILHTEEKDFSKIEAMISENSSELVKDDKTTKNAESKKTALEIAIKIQSGECPSGLEEGIKSYAIKKLASNKINHERTGDIIDCIETLGIDQEKHYTLMTDLIPFWDKKNRMVELFYSRFFKDYKKSNTKILGLLDIAKLMCMDEAISFLEDVNYPANFENAMTKKEYALFLEYINDYRCYGYSSEVSKT